MLEEGVSDHRHERVTMRDIKRPAIVVFRRVGDDEYDCSIVSEKDYAKVLASKCTEQVRTGATNGDFSNFAAASLFQDTEHYLFALAFVAVVATASLIGTAIEWYDFFLYGTAAALIFNKLYFPTFDQMVGTLLAFATYALGFIARPLGGLVFGHYGDRIGRKTMLYLTLLIMGVATAVIGLFRPMRRSAYGRQYCWSPVA